jgi:hypothetical protein
MDISVSIRNRSDVMEANKRRNIPMVKRFESWRTSLSEKIRFGLLYFTIEMKILLMGSPFAKKGLKSLLPLLVGFLLHVTNNPLPAQTETWPWEFSGDNFQITNNMADDFTPSIASNSDLFMAVWTRKTPYGFDIYGARVTPDGKVKEGDEEGIPICRASNDQMLPSITWNGDSFFVVWQDRRSGKVWDIYGSRITPDGQVLDPDGIPISIARPNYDQVAPVVSFDGENYLVVWQGKRSPTIWNIYFVRVSKDGVVMGGSPVPVNPSVRSQVSPSVAFDGKNYFAVWQDFRGGKFWDILGARITPSGEILDRRGILISPSSQGIEYGWDKWRPTLSGDGRFFLIIWMAQKETQGWVLEGKRVSGDGKIVDILDLAIQTDSTNKAFPALVWNGKEYLLVWEEEPEGESRIFGAAISPDYKPFKISEAVQVSFTDMARDLSSPALSTLGNDILIVWQGMGGDGYHQIYGQFLLRSDDILPENVDSGS